MAANLAYDNRKISALDLISQRSQNHFVLIPHIKGMIARNSLARASANIRVLERQIIIEDPLNQVELFLLKAMNANANGALTDALFLTLAAKEFLIANEHEINSLDARTIFAQIYLEESKILLSMGRYERAHEDIVNGMTLAKEIGNRLLITNFEMLYGDYLIDFKLDNTTGKLHYQKAANLAQKIMNPHLIALSLERIGIVLKNDGKLEDGVKICKHAERLFKKLGDERGRILVANTTADLFIAFGHYAKAVSILLELEILGINDPKVYLNLAYAYIKVDELDQAEIYLEKTKIFMKGRGDLPCEFLLIFYEGLIEFQSGSFGKAELLFSNAQEYAEMNKLSKQALKASLQLIHVLVSKNIIFPSKRNFKRAQFAIVDFGSQIKQDENSLDYNNLQFLKATLLFSSKNYSEAKEIFLKLEENYSRLKLHDNSVIIGDYLVRIERLEEQGMYKELQKDQISTKSAVFDDIPIDWNILSPSLDPSEPYMEIQATPRMLLIISDSGLPLYSHNFSENISDMDETLISGFLGAIISFTEQIGQSNITKKKSLERGFLQGIRHGNFEILLERSERYILALVADRENYLLRRQLKRTAEELNLLFLFDDEPIIVLGEKNRYYIQSLINKIF
ncbi:MAG: hypothetical protein ACTSO7_06270 [Candidatus Heimdallarchaeota archaeon]